MRLFIGLAFTVQSAFGTTVAPRPVLTDLQYEEIAKFAALVFGDDVGTDRRARAERALRDALNRLASREPDRAPRHWLAPLDSGIEARVDELADQLVSIIARLRTADAAASEDARRDLAARALTALARLHLTAGANRGENDQVVLAYLAIAWTFIWGGGALVALGLPYHEQVVWMKGLEGASIGAGMGLAGVILLPLYRVITRPAQSADAGRRRVAARVHERFWTRVTTQIGDDVGHPAPADVVRYLVPDEREAVATCGRMLGRPID